ncbi:MAG: tripartite tricarboxylate transporter substrate binding protein [Betaproteobacteria bacterium]|nr:tripartite tricarboxylate transporter substrate binding protein [Betaproteobacteria bacterium]
MMIPRSAILLFSACMIIFGTGTAAAQNYPDKSIRVVTSQAGGGNDYSARLIALSISGSLGQSLIIDNRGGGSGVIAMDIVAKAPADGYTLLFQSNGLWTLPFIQSVPYDIVKDFAPITLSGSTPTILVVHPLVPVKSVRELIALAKSKPGELNYGSASTGSATHLAAELFKSMAGVNIVRVAYKGSGPAITDLIGGQVQLMFAVASSVTQQIKAGRLRALAITTAQPSALAPDLPTVASSGLPGFESASTQGWWAPARTPAAIVARLNQEIVRAINRPDVKQKFFSAGVEVVGSTPEQFAAYIKADMAVVGKLVKDAGIRAD